MVYRWENNRNHGTEKGCSHLFGESCCGRTKLYFGHRSRLFYTFRQLYGRNNEDQEGILLRELMGDPLLTSYSVIVIDEVHERTLLTDIIMGLLKKIMRKRKSLKIVVCSATVDAEQLRDFFNTGTVKDTAVIMNVEGRLYPVDIYFVKEPVANYVTSVVDTVLKIHEHEEPGDVLAFLTGLDEVDQAVSLLSEHAKLIKEGKLKLLPLAMYGSLPNSEQLKVFWRAAKDTRKVIVATNIAETSITIPNVVYVIDCGFVKVPWFEAETQTNSLVIVPVSKASANQRAGRAGRVRSGKAYRLYVEEAYNELFEATPPEMQRSDLAPAILQLKALGIDNVLRFNFPSAPPSKNLLTGLELLYALGAIDSNGELTTPLGVTMAEMPLEPVLAKSLIVSGEMECSEELTTVLAMLQVQNVFIRPAGGQAAIKARVAHRKFEVEEGDLLTMLNVYTAYEKNKTSNWCQKQFLNYKALRRATEIRMQMHSMMKRLSIPLISCNGNVQQILKCITAGLFPKAAYLHYTGVYKTVRGNRDLYIHPTSCLYTLQQPQWLLFCEVLQTNKTYMKDITVIQPEWLLELAPHFYERTSLETV
ncbi:probable ATP-dependent RNA helicase DHX35 isoform X6 [Colletes gigas]|uniref:probable ATP-dependent RNA helicase DHX35 isoform X6 n=1 Tax=Colletes gigas TaxID=935657 RepID=UPI001C9A78BB|nr:probable ATP-dependent RNA helicase DHX35 isoform X6 [Colletes gigas]XP_043260886.1 probable ATP-dependent RNA helicase DHX35 isoform X6 [Colletes gigas]XP_043260887.1 probable ATP-dependent RNA helicase DHX35 isoform X6 [Colletes gigas]